MSSWSSFCSLSWVTLCNGSPCFIIVHIYFLPLSTYYTGIHLKYQYTTDSLLDYYFIDYLYNNQVELNMEIFLLFIALTGGINCQLIFPDEFERIGKFNPQNEKQRPPFPTFPQNTYPSTDYNYAPVNNNNFKQAKSVGAGTTVSVGANADTSYRMTSEEIYWANHVNNIIVKGVMKFALDMDRAIDENQRESSVGNDRDNVVFSPISLVATLAMVLLGSAGKTFDEVVNILGFTTGVDISSHSEIVHQMLGLLLNSIDTKSPFNSTGPQASFADGIFVQAGYPVRPEFLAISQAVYNNEVINVDFMRQSDAAQRIINNFVDMRTHGKIRNILAQAPSSDTKVIFASALYFNGEWNQHFIHSGTKRKPFKLASEQTVDVDMMYNSGFFPFYEDQQLGVKIIGLPYKNNEQSPVSPSDSPLFESTMYILLPTSMDSNALNTLESRLSPNLVEELILKMENKSCIVGLPKMKLSSTLNLNRALQSLGLTSLFVPDQANLALLSAGPINSPTLVMPKTSDDPFIFTRINNDETTETAETTKVNLTGKNNYFRYEDKQGGYKIQQWNNGVFVEKIQKSYRQRRQIHRQIDNDFVKFIDKQGFPNYGLDVLRNNAHLINPGLYASEVIHKVEIDITETGTVGAAATSVIIQRDGNSKLLVANRPFTFFIRHVPSRLVLFWGSINKPTPNYPQ